MHDEQENHEFTVETHGWWVTTRPYRVMAELVVFSVVSLAVVIYVLSRTSDDPEYRFFAMNPVYVIGAFSGALGGSARSLLLFWRRRSYNMLKTDYWKHATPFYIGVLFGFLATLILQSGLKVVALPSDTMDPGGLSFISLICVLSGLFADKAERKFLSFFDSSLRSEKKDD